MIGEKDCPSPVAPFKLLMSCKEIYDLTGSKENKAYVVDVNCCRKLPVYYNVDGAGLGDCGGGGWTLVMKINGAKQTFKFDSPFWSNKKEYGLPEGETGLDYRGTKLPTYWNTPFTKICLGMKVGEVTKFFVLNRKASSLYVLIADGKYRKTSLGRDEWMKLITGASLQNNCQKEGFNVPSVNANASKARIGILGNNENDCKSSNSRIGFGTAGYPANTNSCGNVAKYGGDNGDKWIKAMGYIFVQ
ncbi:uncharacterized skeletal organic matrix protein 5-like isoform X1 [Stylophora pistillata]|nr:uncharacterized skeletal organic matrix protein 5-like isoform X1 [Stylophora pistillata]